MEGEELESAEQPKRRKRRTRIRLDKVGEATIASLSSMAPDALRNVAARLRASYPEAARLLLEYLRDGIVTTATVSWSQPVATPPGIAPAASGPAPDDPARGAALNQRRAQEEALRAQAAAKAGAPR